MTLSEAEASSALPERVDRWCDRAVGVARWPAVGVVLAASFAVPQTLGLSAALVPCVAAVVAGAGWAATLGLEPHARSRFWGVLAFAAAFQLLVWLAVSSAQIDSGFVVLGPDGTRFHQLARQLASQHFDIRGYHPIEYFGTADVAHYYLFAGVIALFGDSIRALQLVNIGLLVLATGLTYLWSATVRPRWGLAFALLTATHLPLVLLAALDLWKDPLVILAMSVAVWGMVRTLASERRFPWDGPMAMAAGLVCLHVTRFYAAAYLELAVLLAVGSVLLRRRAAGLPVRVILVVVLASEVVPVLAGWPTTAALFRLSVVHTSTAPQMQKYGRGLVVSSPASADTDFVSEERSDPRTSLHMQLPGVIGRIVVVSVNAVRRIFGPFAWILPDHWTAEVLLRNLYLHYPGMLVWYALLPLIVAGLVITAWHLRTFTAAEAPLVALALYIGFYFVQYFAINLAVRQRDIMFPFLLPFAVVACERLLGSPTARWIYASYWVLLVALAIGHLAVRSALGLS